MQDAATDVDDSQSAPGIRLIVPADAPIGRSETSTATRTLTLAGRPWTVVQQRDSAAVAYSCVSYVWSRSRTPHPLASDQMISARAVPVLETTIATCNPTAVWLDALCVPFDEPARTATLRSMGAIYGGAAHVIVVLSSGCARALDQIRTSDQVDETALRELETDEWVTRAWTYQECANSATAVFCAEGSRSQPVPAAQLLDAIGKAMVDYGTAHALDAFEVRNEFLALDGLQDTLAEWMIGGVGERTALQVMTAVALRSPEATPEDRLNAMIGAVDPRFATEHSSSGDSASLFMRACEAKGEYSFIYTSAPRSQVPGRTWQPMAEVLPPVLSWHSFGEGQRGRLSEQALELHGIARARRGPLSNTATQFITEFVHSGQVEQAGDIAQRVLTRLRQATFSGSDMHVELEEGLFFPQCTRPLHGATIVIATGVRWAYGAPALALFPEDSGKFVFGDVGVFVGPIPVETISLSIA